jgi:RNA polymerase sigma-70 factor (ECF subfamily)
VRGRILRVTRNWEDTEDILQETYLKSYIHLDQFDGRARFSTWLVRIAINSALMLLRKRHKKCELLTENGDLVWCIANV